MVSKDINMNFKERVLELVEAGKNLKDLAASQIWNDGKKKWKWKKFDFEKGLDDLIKVDRDGFYILMAGEDWKEFDYEKGAKALLKKDKVGEWIQMAGTNWKNFDYEHGLSILSKKYKKHHYRDALENWPRGIKMSKAISKDIKSKAKQMPKSRKYEL